MKTITITSLLLGTALSFGAVDADASQAGVTGAADWIQAETVETFQKVVSGTPPNHNHNHNNNHNSAVAQNVPTSSMLG